MLGGSTCARQNPVISEGTDRWRCGGGLSGHAVSRVPVTSAPTIGYTRDSSQGASAAPRRAVLANLRGKNVRKHPLEKGNEESTPPLYPAVVRMCRLAQIVTKHHEGRALAVA